MSQTPAASRTLGGADEFERRMRMIGQPAAAADDPLAELARLVGQEDPFRGVFPQRKTAPSKGEVKTARVQGLAPAPVLHPIQPDAPNDEFTGSEADYAAFEQELRGPFEIGEEPGAPDDAAVVQPAPARVVAAPAVSLEPEARSYPAVSIDPRQSVEPAPDDWAQGAGAPSAAREAISPDGAGSTNGSSRRTLIVLAAVIVLTGGGLAASFLVRSPGHGLANSASAPTIMATTSPSKVQPERTATDPDAPSEPSTLLDKNKNDGTASAKLVDNTEQPVDLAQTVGTTQTSPAQTGAIDDTRQQSSTGFPEPRKVRTVVVRPDGSIIGQTPVGNAVMASAATSDADAASLAFSTKMAIPPVPPDNAASAGATDAAPAPAVAAPQPAATKATVRIGTTPAAPQDANAGPASTSQAPMATAKPKQAAAPARTPPKPRPVEVATAETPTTGSTSAAGASGNFAVQIGAPPTEQEAKEASSRFIKKFSEQLGSYRPAIHKAEIGDKSVYRIRVGGLSQDAAKALCSKLQAGGGGCFVVRN